MGASQRGRKKMSKLEMRKRQNKRKREREQVGV